MNLDITSGTHCIIKFFRKKASNIFWPAQSLKNFRLRIFYLFKTRNIYKNKYRTSASRTRPPRVPYKFVGAYCTKFRFVFFPFEVRNPKKGKGILYIIKIIKNLFKLLSMKPFHTIPHMTRLTQFNILTAVPCIKTLFFYDLITNV